MRVLLIGIVALLLMGCGKEVAAQPVEPVVEVKESEGITIKQGMLYVWDDVQIKNASSAVIARTTKGEGWPSWVNMLWDGWALEGGLSYDGSGVKGGHIVIAREFGTLANYLPMEFPLADKFNISLQVIGINIEDTDDGVEVHPVSGISLLEARLRF